MRVQTGSTGRTRVRLDQLPSSHGRQSASNPNWHDRHLDLTDQRHHRTS
jgi:hypothetical protein